MSSPVDSRTLRNLIVVPRRDLAVEFANTLAWRGSAPAESLHSVGDLIAWLSANKVMPTSAIAELQKWFEAHPSRAATVFSGALEIRESIYRLLRRVASSSYPTSED